MSKAMKIALACAVATCGACAKTVPLGPRTCLKPLADTLWFATATNPHASIAAITSECP